VPYPTSYNGKQFFANYARDTISTWNPSQPGSDATAFGTPGDGTLGNFGAPVDLQISPTGNVAYIGIADKALHEIVYSPANAPPRAQASATPQQGASPLTVQFSSAGTSDPNGDELTYHWDFGDGFISSSPNPTHTFARGSYDIVLTVRDPSGAEATAGVPIDSGNTRPTVTFLSPSPSTTYRIGEAITLQMSGYDPEDGPLTGSRVTWNLILHHGNHLHPDAGGGTGTTATFVVPDHGDDSYLEFQAQSVDSLGAKSQVVSLILHPQTTPVVVDSIPPGAPIVVDGQDQVAPYGWESIPGGSHSVTAGPSFKRTKKNYSFSQWVANGTPSTVSTYLFTTPDSPLSLQAQYATNIKLVTTPTGLQMVWDGIIVKGGSTVAAVPNSQHDLAAISPQAVNGLAYQFGSWSDGQGREHTLTAGEGGTITATFVRVNPSPAQPGTPTATISAPSGRKFKGRAGDVVTYSGSASDPEQGSLPGSALNWTISVKRGTTTSLVQIGTGASGTFTIPAPFSGNDKVLVAVTAVDADGRAGTASYSFGAAP
jgi:PKD repeat protein